MFCMAVKHGLSLRGKDVDYSVKTKCFRNIFRPNMDEIVCTSVCYKTRNFVFTGQLVLLG
jgi:hypothetical protein